MKKSFSYEKNNFKERVQKSSDMLNVRREKSRVIFENEMVRNYLL